MRRQPRQPWSRPGGAIHTGATTVSEVLEDEERASRRALARPEGRWSGNMRDNTKHAEAEVTISNPQGLHARPVMRFVDLASQFESKVCLRKGKKVVDGKSPMEMMLLEATCGTKLVLVAEGGDAQAAIAALRGLIENKFGEG